MQGFES
jgi:predicted  nucleic acid-binding Zn-ribbon protein